MNRWVLAVLGVVVAGGAGWWLLGRRSGHADAVVHLAWSGSHRGNATLPGQVAWCPITRTATLSAVSNDTGMMVNFFESDSLSARRHPVIAPALADSAPHPSAIAAIRWASDSAGLYGFRSVSGVVELTSVGARVSGSLDIRMRAPVGFDTLVMRADFRDLPVVASSVGCP